MTLKKELTLKPEDGATLEESTGDTWLEIERGDKDKRERREKGETLV